MRMFLSLLLLSASFVAPLANASQSVTVTGYVRSWDSDEDGNTIAVYIETSEEEFFYVAAKGKGLELNELEDKMVEVSGTVSKDEDGDSVITVSAYKVIDEE